MFPIRNIKGDSIAFGEDYSKVKNKQNKFLKQRLIRKSNTGLYKLDKLIKDLTQFCCGRLWMLLVYFNMALKMLLLHQAQLYTRIFSKILNYTNTIYSI